MGTIIEPAPQFYVCPLDRALDPGLVGGKAHNLGRMMRLGVLVPAGFVVTRPALDEVLGQDDRLERIASAMALARDGGPPALDHASAASAAIREIVLGAAIPAAVLDAIRAARTALRPDIPLIVRSSAVGEDGAASSFAGQLDSIADVRTEADLVRALLECWASRWSARSIFYQASRGAPILGMGVVIQELVDSAVSGVLFTEAPDGPAGGDLLCEYCYGHGSALVSGALNPGRVLLPRNGSEPRRLEAPEQDDSGDTRSAAALLTDARLSELARVGLSLEAQLGGPQDIEWTIDTTGRLFLVQSRPITARAVTPAERSVDASRPSVTWSNANVNENFPAPISPLLYSLASAGYSNYFLNLARAFGIAERRIRQMEGPLRTIIGVHGARMYYNLTNIHAFISIAPFGDALGDYFNQYVGASSPAGETRAPRPTSKLGRAGDLAELLAVAASTTRQYASIENKIREFEAIVDAFADRTRPSALGARSAADLLGDLRDFVDIRCNRWTNASLADVASAVCYGVLRQVLRNALPSEDHGAIHNNLLKGLSDIVSSEPALDIWELSRLARAEPELRTLLVERGGRAAFDAIRSNEGRFPAFRAALDAAIQRWGFRGSGELMLTEPSFQEDPAALLDIVRAYIAVDGPSPADVMRQRNEERDAETARVLDLLRQSHEGPQITGAMRARGVSLLLRFTRRSIALRERARLKQALLYSRLRGVALAIGERLASNAIIDRRDDIFFLTHQEIEALLAGGAMFPYRVRSLIALRKEEHESLSKMSPPDVVTLPFGEYLPPPTSVSASASSSAPVPASTSVPISAPASDTELRGAGTCGGRVRARAAVLRDMSEAHRLSSGDALVTRQTDPGWGPVFFLIKGLVMERGGMLSHGAIIAREFGIPAVVGVRDATRLIHTGDMLDIDGDRGLVHVERAIG